MLQLAFVPIAHTQPSLHPQQLNAAITVQALQLPPAADSIWSTGPDRAELERRLVQERARFGNQMTVDELHQVADALTMFVRERGYAFHTVYLPPQKVQSGTVKLAIQEGILSDVHLINQSELKAPRFLHPFEPLVGKTLYAPAVEQRVQALKMQTGFKVFPFYSRGVEPGETRLNLRIQNAAKRQFSIRADNYGSKTTGQERLIASYTEHQLTGRHDRLSLAVLQSMGDENNTYGSVQYVRPSSDLRYAWDASLSNNQFDVGDRFANLGLQGDTRSWNLGITRYGNFHPRSRSELRLSIGEKDSEIASPAGTAHAEISRTATLSWQKRLQGDSGRWLWQSLISVSGGVFGADSSNLDDHFNKVAVTQFWVVTAAKGSARQVWQLSLRGQYGDAPLPSSEGLTLTGAYGVRAFQPSAFNAANGALLSLEWRWPNVLTSASGNWRAEPFLHSDWAYGDDGEGENFSWAEYGSAGAGLRLQLGKRIQAQITYAASFSGTVNSVEVEDDEQLLFEIRWQ